MKTLKELNDQKKWLKGRVGDEIDRAFRFGAESERIKLMDEFGRKDRTTRFERATERDRDVHGENLAGWCTECGAPIEGRWVFGINFCPYCGRRIDWDASRDDEGSVKYRGEVEE